MADLPNLDELMKKAQDMQKQMESAQNRLASLEVTGESGGGMVKAIMNGKHEVKRVIISSTIMDDKEMVEDLAAAAFNKALEQINRAAQGEMATLAKSLELSAGLDLPFSDDGKSGKS